MNPTDKTYRHDFFRFSLLGFAFITISSPFVLVFLDRSIFGGLTSSTRDILLLAYPAMGTIVAALFLANSSTKTLEAAKILAIPTLAFGVLIIEVMRHSYQPVGLWLLLFANIWLSGILRQRAYQNGHANSAYLLLAHQILGIALTLACNGDNEDLAVLLGAAYWFGAIGCYFTLWLESRYGPRYQALEIQKPAVEL